MQDKLIEAEIDDGILGVVLVLNDAGVKTFSSCQGGGYGWGHGYLRPIVCFDGDDSEGERAEKIATDAGYQVFQVQRVWYTRDGERVGPFWEMEFVAGAACRAPKDRAAVRAHDAPEMQPWWEKEWAESFKKYREYAAQHGCPLGGDLLEFVLQDALAYRAAHDAGTDERLRKAAHNLAVALEQYEKPMNRAFGLAQIHGMDYTEGGRWSYGVELDELKRSLQNLPPASHAAASTAQLDAEDPAEPVEDVPPGYVKMEDVEKAIWDQFGTWIGTTNFKDGLSEIRARLAPKPPLAEEMEPILTKHFKTIGVVDCATELAALVERRTK